MDDVEIRLCTPKIQFAGTGADTTVCINKSLTMTATYPDNGNPFGNSVIYRWEFRCADSAKWKTLDERIQTVPLSVSWKIDSADKANEGYYRLLVSKQGNIDLENCRASSDSVHLKVMKIAQFPDVRIQVSPTPGRIINLTSFLDSINCTGIRWEKVTVRAPAIQPGTETTTGSVNSSSLAERETYIYKYTASTQCGQSDAVTYIRTLKDKVLSAPDTVTVCRTHESSKSVHLNQILGLELGGAWKYDSSVNHDATVTHCVTEVSTPSKYAGMLLFDAAIAWNTAPPQYSINFQGHSDAKAFRFEYHSPTAFSFPVKKELVIVVTK
jgi:hypothetical protein